MPPVPVSATHGPSPSWNATSDALSVRPLDDGTRSGNTRIVIAVGTPASSPPPPPPSPLPPPSSRPPPSPSLLSTPGGASGRPELPPQHGTAARAIAYITAQRPGLGPPSAAASIAQAPRCGGRAASRELSFHVCPH